MSQNGYFLTVKKYDCQHVMEQVSFFPLLAKLMTPTMLGGGEGGQRCQKKIFFIPKVPFLQS